MIERNMFRVSLKVSLRQRLMVVGDLQTVDVQMRALGLLGWSSTDAACIVSLRHSCVWDTLMEVLKEPLYEGIAAGTIVDWAVEYRSYPVCVPYRHPTFLTILHRSSVSCYKTCSSNRDRSAPWPSHLGG
jgi:hypothetical protein